MKVIATGCSRQARRMGGVHASMQASCLPQCVFHPLHLPSPPHMSHAGHTALSHKHATLLGMCSSPDCSTLPLV